MNKIVMLLDLTMKCDSIFFKDELLQWRIGNAIELWDIKDTFALSSIIPARRKKVTGQLQFATTYSKWDVKGANIISGAKMQAAENPHKQFSQFILRFFFFLSFFSVNVRATCKTLKRMRNVLFSESETLLFKLDSYIWTGKTKDWWMEIFELISYVDITLSWSYWNQSVQIFFTVLPTCRVKTFFLNTEWPVVAVLKCPKFVVFEYKEQ